MLNSGLGDRTYQNSLKREGESIRKPDALREDLCLGQMTVNGPQPSCKGRTLLVSWCQEVQGLRPGLPKEREAKGRVWFHDRRVEVRSRAESSFVSSRGAGGWLPGSALNGFRGVKVGFGGWSNLRTSLTF